MRDKDNKNREDLGWCVERALLDLMKEKPFGEILIKEILRKSGVSKDFFYRRFKTKEAVAESCITGIFEGMGPIEIPGRSITEAAESDLDCLLANRETLLPLHKNGLTGFLQPLIRKRAEQRLAPYIDRSRLTFQAEHSIAAHASALCELVKIWLDYGMEQSPKELMEITGLAHVREEYLQGFAGPFWRAG